MQVRTNGTVALDSDEVAMAQWLATRGSISVSESSPAYSKISADFVAHKSFYNYGGGVFNPSNCTEASKLSYHEAVLVGYGTQDGQSVWIMKNSWGTKWGDVSPWKLPKKIQNGYAYIQRGANVCRIQSSAHGIAGIAYSSYA